MPLLVGMHTGLDPAKVRGDPEPPNPLLQGNKSVLTFRLQLESVNPAADRSTPLALLCVMNSHPWRGKEPRSCMVVDFQQARSVPFGKTAMMDQAEFTLQVGYRPPGWISNVRRGGAQRLNGWMTEMRDQKNDGTLLDGKGQPLPAGAEPVYLQFRMYHEADFNDFDFGDFVNEQ